MNVEKWINENCEDLTGKTVVITGGTGGLGKIWISYLARLNANIILAGRNENKSKKIIEDLTSVYPNAKFEFLFLDLEDINSVKLAVEKLKKIKIDYFIHNSGIYNVKRKITNANIDNVFQVNFVAPYYITKELLPTFRNCKTKVVATGSIAHNYSQIDEQDIEFKTRKKSSKIYGNSKRFLMFSLFELFKNETKTTLTIAHPGVTLTNMTNHYPITINWLVKIGIKLFFPSPKKATLNLLKSMFEECKYLEWFGPTIFNIWGKGKKKKLNTATEEEIKKIFAIAENYYNNIKNKK